MSESKVARARAVHLLREAVRGFRFASLADEATWIALVLTVVARELGLFAGPAPLFLISGEAGVGKSALARTTGLITTGAEPMVAWPTSDEREERALITDAAIRGVPLVCFEGVEGRWGSRHLTHALTSDTWRDRVLGGSKSFDGTLCTAWVATANGVLLSDDMARRVAHIRLDEPAPFDAVRFARGRRGELKAAALTLLELAGKDDGFYPMEPWGTYDRWSGVVRRALLAAGLPDVLTPRALLALESVGDAAGTVRHGFREGLEPESDRPEGGRVRADRVGKDDRRGDLGGYAELREGEGLVGEALLPSVERGDRGDGLLNAGLGHASRSHAAKSLTIPEDVKRWIRERAADLTTSQECLLRALVFVCVEAERRDENALVEAVERAMLRRELVSNERAASAS